MVAGYFTSRLCVISRCDISWVSGCDYCRLYSTSSSGKNFARISNRQLFVIH